MSVVGTTPVLMPSILSMVQRVKRECGLPVPSTLVGTTDPENLVCLDALNDASSEIYRRNRWEWTVAAYGLPLVQNVKQYPLPADFYRMAQDPVINGSILSPLEEEDFYRKQELNSTSIGCPQTYTAHGYVFEVWPTPDAGVVAKCPILRFKYYRQAPKRLDGSDDAANLNLPPEFLECVIAFAKWKVKEFREYPDAVADRQRYEETLRLLVQGDRAIRGPIVNGPRGGRRKVWS